MSGDFDVVFGAGALGRATARELVARGRKVRMVSRRAGPAPEGVESYSADATQPQAVRKACEGARAVFHMATPDYTKWAQLYPPIQRGILEGLAGSGAKLVSAESVYMYGLVDGEMTEDRPQAPTTRKGRIRAELARMAMEAHEKGQVRVALARGPDFYGPEADVTAIYGERVFRPALAGKRVDVMGKLDLPHTFIYLRDFARGMVVLAEHEEAFGQAWHVPCAPTLTQRELLTLIFEEAGHPPKLGQAPSFIFSAMGLFMPIMRELAEMLYQWERSYHFNHDKFERAFGKQPVTAHRDAVRATVKYFREHPAKA